MLPLLSNKIWGDASASLGNSRDTARSRVNVRKDNIAWKSFSEIDKSMIINTNTPRIPRFREIHYPTSIRMEHRETTTIQNSSRMPVRIVTLALPNYCKEYGFIPEVPKNLCLSSVLLSITDDEGIVFYN